MRYLTQMAPRWTSSLDNAASRSWRRLEELLLTSYPEEPTSPQQPQNAVRVESARRVKIRRWETEQGAGFLPSSRKEWLQLARARRAVYDETGLAGTSDVHWILVEGAGTPIPEEAIQTGIDARGEPLYTMRAWHKGQFWVGKCANHLDGELHLIAVTFIANQQALIRRTPCVVYQRSPEYIPLRGSGRKLLRGSMDRHGRSPSPTSAIRKYPAV